MQQSTGDSGQVVQCQFLANNRVVFNISGNKYRLIVKVDYDFQVIFIRFIGSHAEYDKVDASII